MFERVGVSILETKDEQSTPYITVFLVLLTFL